MQTPVKHESTTSLACGVCMCVLLFVVHFSTWLPLWPCQLRPSELEWKKYGATEAWREGREEGERWGGGEKTPGREKSRMKRGGQESRGEVRGKTRSLACRRRSGGGCICIWAVAERNSVCLHSNLGQYLSGQGECLSVGSVSCLVLFDSSVYEPHLQRCLPSHTPTWEQTDGERERERACHTQNPGCVYRNMSAFLQYHLWRWALWPE